MSDTISIGELEKMEREATCAPWSADAVDDRGTLYVCRRGDYAKRWIVNVLRYDREDNQTGNANARLIAASRNATPTLIAIAKAALLHEQARVAFETSAQSDDRPVFEGKRAAMQQAHRELLSALKAVRL